MSNVHLYTLSVAEELHRVHDVDGLERIRAAQLRYQRECLDISRARWWRRKHLQRLAEDRLQGVVTAALGGARS